MGHKCFVSFKKEDNYYKEELVKLFSKEDIIDKTLDRVIESENGDYIMQVIRNDYLKDSTITICLIGVHSSEKEGYDYFGRPKNYFIIRELQASLYNGKNNTRNGILGVVTPEMYENIFCGTYMCSSCGYSHNYVKIDDDTVIREFSQNYYIEPHEGCSWNEYQRYCVLVKWDDFIENPEMYVNKAYEKRTDPIVNKIIVRAKR